MAGQKQARKQCKSLRQAWQRENGAAHVATQAHSWLSSGSGRSGVWQRAVRGVEAGGLGVRQLGGVVMK